MIVTLSRIPAVPSAPKRSRGLRSLSLGVLFFFFQKRLLLFLRLCPPSKTLFFSFPAVILHLPRRGYPHSRTLFFSYRDIVSLCFGVLQDGECGMVVDGRVFGSSGKASETRYCRKRLGRIAMRHGSGRLSLSTGSLLRCEVRLCLVSRYARCCLTYPKPLASQTPSQSLVVAIKIWPKCSRFSLLLEYPSKPSAVDSTSSRTALLE
jgi:hypothetical protein